MSHSASALQGLQLSEEKTHDLIKKAQEWALLHGVQMKQANNVGSSSVVEYSPMTLFPSLMPASVLQEARSLQTHYNRLMHKVAYNHEFLGKSLKNVIQVDSFTRMLWNIYTTVRNEGLSQPISLGLFRNDYMLDVKDRENDKANPALKQIEFNTVASSFGGLVSGVWRVHRYTMTLAGVQFKDEQIPESLPAAGLARGLVRAWEIYNHPSAVILFVVTQEAERNKMDQLWIEREVFQMNRHIRVIWTSLPYAAEHSELRPNKTYWVSISANAYSDSGRLHTKREQQSLLAHLSRRLTRDGSEVAVIYFRAGYIPNHYPTDKEIQARLDMERSKAIKSPSVHYQLAGCKKIQQELAAPGVLERFIEDKLVVQSIRSTFAGQYTLDRGPEGDAAIAMAIKSPHNFVAKPQREGGGNNLYGDDIRNHLEKIKDTDERSAYILMERIFPWPQKNHLLKVGEDPKLRDVVSELGIYGIYIGSQDTEVLNEEVGHLLRTKDSHDNEGGVAAGFATIDTPFLVS